ncbi:M15 family metallopeptidase [Sporosarcina sp. FA15]|uniref:M15 family metallopeptidase n=1 Tax=Sporosarcina sp. FA15 TaxID=3413031 RepID=UPI003F655BA1
MVDNDVLKLLVELIKLCWSENVFIVFTHGLRTMEDQAEIYGKGRASYIYDGKQYGNPKANVVSKAMPGSSLHNYALALDFVTCDGLGKNVDWVVGPKWRHAAANAKELGFTWGGEWKPFIDYPHFQYDGGLSVSKIKQGKFPIFKSIPVRASPSQKPPVSNQQASNQIGVVKILVDVLKVREEAIFTAKVVKAVRKGQTYKTYEKKSGMYNVGGKQWVSVGAAYTKFTTT